MAHEEVVLHLQERVLLLYLYHFRVVDAQVLLGDAEPAGEVVELLGEDRILRYGGGVEVAQKLELRLGREDVHGNRLLRGADIGQAPGVEPGRQVEGRAEYGDRDDE